jgi:tryptophanyl-tRNA synthetase
MNKKKVLFSGVQPSGELHIGNYLGALKQWVEFQNSGEIEPFFSIVDYHSLTQDYNIKEKREQIIKTAVDFIACGIKPKNIFIQSSVSEHTELAWILNCITPISELERMTQYKDKAQRQKENINMGLFDYPVLMAADILLYQTQIVPVGEDQVQHVELARIIARKFNNRFKTNFMIEPKAKLVSSENSARVMSLTSPDKKMSKSLGEKSYIALADSPEKIREKIKSAVTTESGAKNLLSLFEQFSDDTKLINKFKKEFEKNEIKYSEFKPALADAIIKVLKPIQERREKLLKNKKAVERDLNKGAKRARKVAEKNMMEIKKIIGVL